MKRNALISLVSISALVIAAFSARPVAADDETHDVEIKIVAPLDAADCSASPPTISVLGLTIDVSAATIEAQSSATPVPTPTTPPTPGDDGTHHGSRPVPSPGQPGCYYYCPPTPLAAQPNSAGCSALTVGQAVEVKLGSDALPLVATDVKQDTSSPSEDEVQAPLQGADATAQTITVLGLTIDVSGAGVDGSDDDGSSSTPIDLTQLTQGQFVDVKLASSTAPLTATQLEVKNFTNQIAVEMDDANGNALDDVDAAGNPVDDITADVSELVVVQNPPAANGTSTGRRLKRIRLHAGTNGTLALTGLPTGTAVIRVTRTSNGVTTIGRRGVIVRGNTTRSVRIRLRPLN